MEKEKKFEVRRANLHWLKNNMFNKRAVNLARAIGKDASYVSRLLYDPEKTGSKNMAESMRVMIEEALGLPYGWLDVPNAGQKGEEFMTPQKGLINSQIQRSQIEAMANPNLSVPLLSAVGSMGNGEGLHYDVDQIIDVMTVSRNWVNANFRVKPEFLRVVTGAGDSMSPTFEHGDLLLVDTSHKRADIDGVYAMSANDRLYIKRVRQKITGEFEISSDNPTVKTVDVLTGQTEVTILGRVIYSWRGKKL